jgi:hypothetical protein
VREFCTPGSVRGVCGNAYPYRDPGMVSRWSIAWAKGAIIVAISVLSRSMDSSRNSKCARISVTMLRCVGENQPVSALRSAGIVFAQLPAGKLGENIRIMSAGKECPQHRSTRYAQHIASDAGQRDSGTLERLVQPLNFA